MTDTAAGRQPGQHLLDELRWVHDAIRHDLGVCIKLAEDVAAGASQGQVHEQLRALRTNGPLWRLKVNCLTYCRHAHAHHGLEDALLFPAVRRANPALASVVDKLEADHRAVSGLLDGIEEAAARLSSTDTPEIRSALAGDPARPGETASDTARRVPAAATARNSPRRASSTGPSR